MSKDRIYKKWFLHSYEKKNHAQQVHAQRKKKRSNVMLGLKFDNTEPLTFWLQETSADHIEESSS